MYHLWTSKCILLLSSLKSYVRSTGISNTRNEMTFWVEEIRNFSNTGISDLFSFIFSVHDRIRNRQSQKVAMASTNPLMVQILTVITWRQLKCLQVCHRIFQYVLIEDNVTIWICKISDKEIPKWIFHFKNTNSEGKLKRKEIKERACFLS